MREETSDSKDDEKARNNRGRQDFLRSVSRDKSSSRNDSSQDGRRADSRERNPRRDSHYTRERDDGRFYNLDEMRERDQRNSSRYKSSNNINSNPTMLMPPVIPAEGMTMKYS